MRKQAFILFATATGLSIALASFWPTADKSIPEPVHMGSQACAECHGDSYADWKKSHHALALQPANAKTVLGDFSGATLQHYGQTSTFKKVGQLFVVSTKGADGVSADFVVKMVIGVDPLQQYLVDPNSNITNVKEVESTLGTTWPKLQTLPFAWDVHKRKWYHIYPQEDLKPGDPLHWTGWAQNFNHMCADCHTTGFKKNASADGKFFKSTFAEDTVGCEACHGPGSRHVGLQKSWSRLFKKDDYGMKKTLACNPHEAMENCAQCHSLREQALPGFQAGKKFADHYNLNLLNDLTYHSDGQIKEEVYEYGSFLQSKMQRKGVTCMNCHNPHSGRLKIEGNNLCLQCHDAKVFDAPAHHHHTAGSAGSSCVECHMPEKIYMGIDRRRDHSIRIPRPDLSVKLGVPNACVGCHLEPQRQRQDEGYAGLLEKTGQGDATAQARLSERNAWADQQVKAWFPGRVWPLHYGEVFKAAGLSAPEGLAGLLKIINDPVENGPMVRATALGHLQGYQGADVDRTLGKSAYDEDPLIRKAAVMSMAHEGHTATLVEKLSDSSMGVRQAALQGLLALGTEDALKTLSGKSGEIATREAGAIHAYNSDQAGSHMSMALLQEKTGQVDEARNSYRRAIDLHPEMAGARSNLAALLEQNENNADEVLALRREEARLLRRDVGLAPRNHALRYRLGLCLYMTGEHAGAIEELRAACGMAPAVEQYRLTLLLLYEKLGRKTEALTEINVLMRERPGQPMLLELKKRIDQLP